VRELGERGCDQNHRLQDSAAEPLPGRQFESVQRVAHPQARDHSLALGQKRGGPRHGTLEVSGAQGTLARVSQGVQTHHVRVQDIGPHLRGLL